MTLLTNSKVTCLANSYVSQSVNQSINQSIDRSIDRSINQSINKPIVFYYYHSESFPCIIPISDRSTDDDTDAGACDPTNQW